MFDKFIKLLLVFEDVLETSKINAVNGVGEGEFIPLLHHTKGSPR